jgi:hypothetical protein
MNNQPPTCPSPLPRLHRELTNQEANARIKAMIDDHKSDDWRPRGGRWRVSTKWPGFISWILRWDDRRETKQLRKRVQEKATSLKAEAPPLGAEVKALAAKVKALTADARAHPRPAAPPENRDDLFIRPAGAPLSRYEREAQAYNEVLERSKTLRTETQELWSKFADFWNEVRKLQTSYQGVLKREAEERKLSIKKNKGPKKIGRVDHDVEGVENAARNLRMDIEAAREELQRTQALLQ